MSRPQSSFGASAYGGAGWRPREASHHEEIGSLWADCGIDSEWAELEAVLLHRPGAELAASADPAATQMLEPLDPGAAQAQHDALAAAYRAAGIRVEMLDAPETPPPNQMFMADLFAMTPEGAILARPASSVRAGEERWVARHLAGLGMPILRTLTGRATFEGADLIWLSAKRALIGQGLRTNAEGARQVAETLAAIGIEALVVDMPFGTMHLMGMLRIADRDLAIAWPRRTPFAAVEAMKEEGYKVIFLPHEDEPSQNRAFNFVTLGPRRILMVGGNPETQLFYEANGIACTTVEMSELVKAAGAIGCLTGILKRKRVS